MSMISTNLKVLTNVSISSINAGFNASESCGSGGGSGCGAGKYN